MARRLNAMVDMGGGGCRGGCDNNDARPFTVALPCRWVKLRDRCSLNELPVKLWANSQSGAFLNIRSGDVVLLTNLQLLVAVDSVGATAVSTAGSAAGRSLHARSELLTRSKSPPPHSNSMMPHPPLF